ncbi:hypothetical protein B296_00033532 [Ensete ventricosum]|uniref:Uncharacterized protein n=1 Tax=Ensete ventricosum TaxID=4639 RepID=A0A426ZPJ6_ENSVE|nr:hypothetical protein B296_00033532 [Ensete ventricosum]
MPLREPRPVVKEKSAAPGLQLLRGFGRTAVGRRGTPNDQQASLLGMCFGLILVAGEGLVASQPSSLFSDRGALLRPEMEGEGREIALRSNADSRRLLLDSIVHVPAETDNICANSWWA